MILPNPPAPGSPEWHKAITASKVPAILGLSPWASPYSVWVSMTTGADPIEETAAMKRGTYLEGGILDWYEADHPDLVPAGRQLAYTLGDDKTCFSTTDGNYWTPAGDLEIVEVKTVGRDDDWRDEDGGWRVPDYYLAQVMFQLATSQASRAVVVALTPHLEKVEIPVERDLDLEAAIVEEIHLFQQALEDGIVPDLDDHVATYDAVRRRHSKIDGSTVEVPFTVAHTWLDARDVKDRAEAAERAAKTRLLDLMGEARLATSEGLTIAMRSPGRGDIVTLRPKAKAADLEARAWA